MEERLVDVGPPFVAHRKPAATGQPRQSTFHHPPVPAKPLAGVLTPPGDARLDAAVGQRLSATGEVVSLVGVQLAGRFRGRPLPGSAVC